MTQLEYSLKLPKSTVVFIDDGTMTFTINNIKSRLTSVMYFVVRFYDMHESLLYTYNQTDRWVIPPSYTSRHHTFEVPSQYLNNIAYAEVELRFVNIDSENPVYFNDLMLNIGEFQDYHQPNELNEGLGVDLINNVYANLYNMNGTYLQVIRPYKDDFHTDKLDKCKCTVLVPHLESEDAVDDPSNIVYEFVNQTEQRIEVLR